MLTSHVPKISGHFGHEMKDGMAVFWDILCSELFEGGEIYEVFMIPKGAAKRVVEQSFHHILGPIHSLFDII